MPVVERFSHREVGMLNYSMRARFDLPPECAWVNYVRVHETLAGLFG